MKIIWGSFITDGRGKIGGDVACRNHYGPFLRKKVTPLNVYSQYREACRARLVTVQQLWPTLTNEERAAWILAAKNFPYKNVFGISKIYTGINLFAKINYHLLEAGKSTFNLPPAKTNVSPMLPSFLISNSYDSNLVIGYSIPIPSTYYYYIFATKPLSQGINVPNAYWKLLYIDKNVGNSDIYLTDAYFSRFRIYPPFESKLFFKILVYDWITGQFSNISISSVITF